MAFQPNGPSRANSQPSKPSELLDAALLAFVANGALWALVALCVAAEPALLAIVTAIALAAYGLWSSRHG